MFHARFVADNYFFIFLLGVEAECDFGEVHVFRTGFSGMIEWGTVMMVELGRRGNLLAMRGEGPGGIQSVDHLEFGRKQKLLFF
jgi:hypothetical protein